MILFNRRLQFNNKDTAGFLEGNIRGAFQFVAGVSRKGLPTFMNSLVNSHLLLKRLATLCYLLKCAQ
jgi:hypothetical protein